MTSDQSYANALVAITNAGYKLSYCQGAHFFSRDDVLFMLYGKWHVRLFAKKLGREPLEAPRRDA
jgi:hypothetical protein